MQSRGQSWPGWSTFRATHGKHLHLVITVSECLFFSMSTKRCSWITHQSRLGGEAQKTGPGRLMTPVTWMPNRTVTERPSSDRHPRSRGPRGIESTMRGSLGLPESSRVALSASSRIHKPRDLISSISLPSTTASCRTSSGAKISSICNAEQSAIQRQPAYPPALTRTLRPPHLAKHLPSRPFSEHHQ